MAKRMTEVSKKWSSTGINLDAAESEARRLEKKGTFAATMDEEAGTVTLSKDDFKSVMGKLGSHKRTAKTAKKNVLLLAFGYLAVTIGFIAVIVGLVNWRLEATKESHVVGSTMVGNDNAVVQTGDVESYAQLFDLPHFDINTLNKIKEVIVDLADGRQFAFSITRVEKSPGSTRLQIQDSNGNGLDIDSCATLAIAKIDGQYFPLKGMSADNRKLASQTTPQLYSASEYSALQTEQRALGVGSSSAGTATFALHNAMAALDHAEGIHQPLDWESAYIESETMVMTASMMLGLARNKVLAERSHGELNYIVGADNGVWYIWIDTVLEEVRWEKNDGSDFWCAPYTAATDGGVSKISNDMAIETPVNRDCNEDGYMTKSTNAEGLTTLTRTTLVDFKTASVRKIHTPDFLLCMANAFQKKDQEYKVKNLSTGPTDPNRGLECQINSPDCEAPIGFQEAIDAGRNLEEDYAQLDRMIEGRDLRRMIRSRSNIRRFDRGFGRVSGGGKGYAPGDTKPSGRCTVGGSGGDAENDHLYQEAMGSTVINGPVKMVTKRGRKIAGFRNLEEERDLDCSPDMFNGIPYHPLVPTAGGWDEYFPHGFGNGDLYHWGIHDEAWFYQYNHYWLGHVMACLHGSSSPNDCGNDSGTDGSDRGPMWTAWAVCEWANSRGGYAYAFPVVAAMYAGTGGSPDQNWFESLLNVILDMLMATLGSLIPFVYHGYNQEANGGLFPKLHHGGTVLYVMFIDGCMGSLGNSLDQIGGQISFNVGHSLGGAGITVYSQSRPPMYKIVTWGAYPTCFDPGYVEEILGLGAIDFIPDGMFEDSNGDANDIQNDINEYLNNEFTDYILWDCSNRAGVRTAGIWDPITGMGSVTRHIWDKFVHDLDSAQKLKYNCGIAGNSFAAFALIFVVEGILLNGIVLLLNVVIEVTEWVCDGIVEFFTFGQSDCDVPNIEYIDPTDYCEPGISTYNVGVNYSGGGLWNGSTSTITDVIEFLLDCIPGNAGMLINTGTVGPFWCSTLDCVVDVFQFAVFHTGEWYARGIKTLEPNNPPFPNNPPPAPQAPNGYGGGDGPNWPQYPNGAGPNFPGLECDSAMHSGSSNRLRNLMDPCGWY